MNLEHIPAHERAHLLASANDYHGAMKQVDALVLSTSYLRELAQAEFGGRTYLWRNLVDSATLSIVENLGQEEVKSDSQRVTIGYASGSRAHDEDFKVVASALARVLENHDNVDFQVVGYAVMPPELEHFKDRINTRPFAGYLKYFEALNGVDINIVPLVDDRFNACKSAIRYLEASLCRVPTVASSVGQFSEVIVDGQDGNLALNQDQWVSALTRLIESPQLRVQMGEAANRKVRVYHTFSCPDVIERELLDQFELSNV